MIPEQDILASLCSSRELSDSVAGILREDDVSVMLRPIYKEIIRIYEEDGAQRVDFAVLQAAITRKYPKHAVELCRIIQEFRKDTQAGSIINEVVASKKFNAGAQLAGALLMPTAAQAGIDKLIEQYQELGLITDPKEGDGAVVGRPVAELAAAFSPTNTFPVFPKSLAEKLGGGVPPHTHIGLIGAPEMGKTLFAINLAAGYLRKGLRVLYVGLEDPEDAYLMRFVARLTGMRRADIVGDVSAAQARSDSAGYGRLMLAGKANTFQKIEALVKKHTPALVVLDQLRQIDTPGATGDTEQLTVAAKQARRLCKQYNIIVLSITQAGESARGKLVLDMGDVYMNKTTFAGDVDILIGWGCNNEFEESGRRMISLPKNKITGVHGFMPVSIDTGLSKIVT